MPTSGHNADLKLAAAEKRLAELQSAVKVWAEAQTVSVIEDHDRETGWHRYRVAPLPEGPGDWVVLVGEVAYHLRSALNYVHVGLVRANNGTVNGSHQFPIYSKAKPDGSSPDGMAQRMSGIASVPAKIIEDLQPYKRPNRPQLDALEFVAEMSNLDKHEDVHAVGFVTGAANEPLVLKMKPEGDVTISEMAPPHAIGSPIDKTYLTEFRATPTDLPIPIEMDNVAVAVVFRGRVDVEASGLPAFIVEVRAVIDKLRPHL